MMDTLPTHEVSALIQFSSAFSPPSQLNTWISCLSVFRSKSLEFITSQLPLSSRESESLSTFSQRHLFSVSLPPFSCPPCPEYLRPCALIFFKTLALYKSRTYILTYLLIYLHSTSRLKFCTNFRDNFVTTLSNTNAWFRKLTRKCRNCCMVEQEICLFTWTLSHIGYVNNTGMANKSISHMGLSR